MGKILVTGGAGFIGSHVCVSLCEAGYDVVILDNFSNARPETVDNIRRLTGRDIVLHSADLLDERAVEDVFARHAVDAVIHLAGLKSVPESVQKPLEYYQGNLIGTLGLLRAMRKHHCRTMVFSSSATVYGMSNPIPFTEEMPTSATNPYGWTKVMLEQILRDVCVADADFGAVLLRYFNPVGAHKSGLIGEEPRGIPGNAVPLIAKAALGELPAFTLTGDDFDTPDGTGVRDYIHVSDLAEGHVAALRYALEHPGAEAVNLGSGQGTSVRELLRAYEKACGRPIPVKICPRRPGDIGSCYADVSKAGRLLGWKARRGVEEMCEDSWRFVSLAKEKRD